jgi:hypothetical protein
MVMFDGNLSSSLEFFNTFVSMDPVMKTSYDSLGGVTPNKCKLDFVTLREECHNKSHY